MSFWDKLGYWFWLILTFTLVFHPLMFQQATGPFEIIGILIVVGVPANELAKLIRKPTAIEPTDTKDGGIGGR